MRPPQWHAAFALGPCEPMIALVSVDLKDAVEALEDALSMSATASWCVVVDHDWWISAAVAAIVAQDSPQITGLRSAPARIEHGRPGLVHEQAARLLHHDAHALDQRREVEGDRSHPVCQNGAIDEDYSATIRMRAARQSR